MLNICKPYFLQVPFSLFCFEFNLVFSLLFALFHMNVYICRSINIRCRKLHSPLIKVVLKSSFSNYVHEEIFSGFPIKNVMVLPDVQQSHYCISTPSHTCLVEVHQVLFHGSLLINSRFSHPIQFATYGDLKHNSEFFFNNNLYFTSFQQ